MMLKRFRPLLLLVVMCLASSTNADDETDGVQFIRAVDGQPKPAVTKAAAIEITGIPKEDGVDKSLVKAAAVEPIQLKPLDVQKIPTKVESKPSSIRTYSRRLRKPAPRNTRRRYFAVPFWRYRTRRQNSFRSPRRRVYIRRRQRPVSYVIRNGRRIFRRPFIQYQWQTKKPKTNTLVGDIKTLSNRIRPRITLFGKKPIRENIPVNNKIPRKPIKIGKPSIPSKDKSSVFNIPKIRGARKHFQKSAVPENIVSQSLEKKPSLRPDNIVRLSSFMGRRRTA